jgi:hypothetical protein
MVEARPQPKFYNSSLFGMSVLSHIAALALDWTLQELQKIILTVEVKIY